MTSDALIPADLAASVERQTGAKIVGIVPRAGGGASRQGAELTFRWPDGREQTGYLSYDSRAADPLRMPFFRREAAVLAAFSGSLANRGVRAPRFMAAEPAHLALLTALAAGSDRFADATEPHALADDFIAQLAALHRIAPSDLTLDGFGDAATPPSIVVRERIAQLQADNLATMPDPILTLALQWLAANIPADLGPSVLVHGDAGPGNFLHQDNRVTALLDWELTHFGDPVEDLAQIWVRSMFQPFRPMREVFKAYEAHAGAPVDVDRVRYHRLYFQLGFTVSGHASFYGKSPVKPAMIGVSMLFYTAHMRVIVQSIAELTGQALLPVDLPDAPAGLADRTFEIALEDLQQAITPRLTDQHAATKAKSLARLVKWWRARDRYGDLFERAECDEVGALLGETFDCVLAARAALTHALLEDRVDRSVTLQLCYRRVVRETALMGDAMGSLRDCYFPPLD